MTRAVVTPLPFHTTTYAAKAFAVVLEQHDWPIGHGQVMVQFLYQGIYSLYHKSAVLEAAGIFHTTEKGGKVILGPVTRWNDKGEVTMACVFNTEDEFRGRDAEGVPILIRQPALAA